MPKEMKLYFQTNDKSPVKPSIEKLKESYAGQPVVVLGAGPSLPADLGKLARARLLDSILISVNHHPLELLRTDYLVFCDDPDLAHHQNLRRAIISYRAQPGGTLISPRPDRSDYVIDYAKNPHFWCPPMTGGFASWLACYLGGDPVLLCGMDLYQGPRVYFNQKKGPAGCPPHKSAPVENHLRLWRPALNRCPHAERIRAVSGPLVDIFGSWKRSGRSECGMRN